MYSTKFLCHKRSIAAAIFLSFVIIQTSVKAQLNPLASQYFQNQYLFNPAMAGINNGLNLNLSVRKQWSSIPGSPFTQAISADYLLSRAAFGVNVYNEQSGLLKSTRAVATYAYHIPLGQNNQKLNFGLSAGVLSQRVPYNEVIGDPNDLSVARYNERKSYLDGDFGVAYTSNNLSVQAALPNLRSIFNQDNNNYTIDRSLYFTSVGYRFNFGETINAIGLEPKVSFRGVKGYTNILDAGANLTFANNLLSFQGMYHSTKSTTVGFGLNKNNYSILAFYTTETSAISNYTNGDFEISLQLHLFDK
ncbi:PorP/SprF family type IX secretion system membrane protein [Mucilaginibacter arboris]|uniref:Type IX secretion system membrane protein PorP/SprF n=1 Tax=Mucilaginibacter arboris TaxID=2682090 RepID=A0A7K1T074_9SPHI|nr:PorP/SprF family type IX secretion system membrane protein [Mucilaginibacter arboris]MVN22953.1 type IX secretion system membrane protein PorP/SprF [Mucilaginibacter arboris]